MYKLPLAPEKERLKPKFTPGFGSQNLKILVKPQQEPSLPLEQRQLDALRADLNHQDWLDNLMAHMRAAGNDTRIRILFLLWRRGEVRVNDLAAILELTTPAISQQLKKLRACSLVHSRRDAQTIYYRLNTESDFIRSLVILFEEERN